MCREIYENMNEFRELMEEIHNEEAISMDEINRAFNDVFITED